MPTYADIYVRAALDDNGQIPYAGAFASLSPDIIPQQQTTQPLAWFGTTWAQNPGLDVVGGVNNFIYVRGKNLGSTTSSGTVFLYSTPSSLLLDVSYWGNNPVSTGAGPSAPLVDLANNPQIAAGAICVGNSPFILNQPVPQGFHYCLIARLVTPSHPNPMPVSFRNTAAFVNWVTDNPNIAWHNINTVASTSGAVSGSAYFPNLDATAETYWFVAQATGFPDKSVVVLQGLTAGCAFSYTGYFGPPGGPQTVMTAQSVPANFKGVVNVTVTPPSGQSIPSGATLDIRYFRQTQGADLEDLVKHAKPADSWNFHPDALAEVVGDGDIPGVVWLGSCTTLVK